MCCRRVGVESGLVASYGVNTFLVQAPLQSQQDYPHSYDRAVVHGRLVSSNRVISVTVSTAYSRAAGGYIGSFDLRDAGVYTLQASML